MRVGILTFHFGNNYGGILQCYALQKVIKSYGHTVEIINYLPTSLPLKKRLLNKFKSLHNIKDFTENLRRIKIKDNKENILQEEKVLIIKSFDEFRTKNLNISEQLTKDTIGRYANSHYDAIVVGSDQVWTSIFDPDSIYFIGWGPDYKGKRISYAACSAHSCVRGKRRKELQTFIKKFDIITVRDATTRELVNNIINEKPEIVPDPTQLYDFKEFISSDSPEEPYILTYILGGEIIGGHLNAIKKIKEQVGDISVYSIINPSNSVDIALYSDKSFYHLGPIDWVNLFTKARIVYTDSFHGIMFSMKFNIPFLGYYKDIIRSSRLLYLKETLKTLNIVNNIEQIDRIEIVDQKVNDVDWIFESI
ncbi:MAG: polysaccharide pyruvyl transferase family protein [Peptostreptococcaceae bacterium]